LRGPAKRSRSFSRTSARKLKRSFGPTQGPSVVKNTGIVLLIVAIIGVVVFGIDTGLSELLKLMMKAAKGSEETTTAAAAAIFSRFGGL